MGLDYVDIFYSHRVDPKTPLEETMGALDTAVRQGKALYVGISSYSAKRTAEAATILRDLGTPLPHPPAELFDAQPLDRGGQAPRHAGEGGRRLHLLLAAGARACSPTSISTACRQDSRAASGSGAWRPGFLSEDNLAAIRGLNEHRQAARPDAWPQMAIAWVLRDPRVTSALIGASRPEQIIDAVGAVAKRDFSPDELAEIDQYAKEGGINLWRMSSAA